MTQPVKSTPPFVAEVTQGADDIVSSIERCFGFSRDRWDHPELKAEPRYICPVCHCPREEHGCTTRTTFQVEDRTTYVNGDGLQEGRRSSVRMSVWCHHPDTFGAVAAARRYHEIEPLQEK